METYKVCLKCETERSAKRFGTNHANADSKNFYCKDCAAIYPRYELLLLGVKTCTCCKAELPRTAFDVRGKEGKTELRPKCKECLYAERQQKYWENPEKFRKRASEAAKRYRAENPDKIHQRDKEKRANGVFNGKPWKEYMAEYRESNHDKLAPKQKVRSLKHHEHGRDNLTDSYVIAKLIFKTPLKSKDLRQMDGIESVIEAKRNILKLKRIIKVKSIENGENKDS